MEKYRIRKKRRFGGLLSYIITIIIVLFLLFPVFWFVSISLKSSKDAFAIPPKIITKYSLDNYKTLLFGSKGEERTFLNMPSAPKFPRNILNSAVVGALSTLGALIIGVPAAYSLARFNLRGKKFLSFYILSSRMSPPIAVLIPFYLIFSRLRILDTHIALIFIYMIFAVSLVVWMMRGFFQEIPKELEEAAIVDGCTRLSAIWKIVIPLAAPGLAATSILALLFSWNEFLYAAVIAGNIAKTAPVAVYSFVSYRETDWGSLCAAGTLTAIPILVFVLLVQKHLVRGLTAGAIKG